MSIMDNVRNAFSGDYTRAQPQAPILLGQGTNEVIQDPLLKDLYFGSQGSPGFLNQLQQAGSNLIGQNVPLQQTAGISNLENRALNQAEAGIGAYKPFLTKYSNLLDESVQGARDAYGYGNQYLPTATTEIGQGVTSLLGSLGEARGLSRTAASNYDNRLLESEGLLRDTTGGYNQLSTDAFYNPYEQQVVDQTLQDINRQYGQAAVGESARQVAGGAFGGSRGRLNQEEIARQFGRGATEAIGGIRAGGYNQAQQLGMGEFQRQLDARRQAASGLSGLAGQRLGSETGLASTLAGYGQGEEAGRGRYASGLMGIGQQKSLNAAGLGQALAGYGGQMGQLGGYGQQLGQAQRQELVGLGSIPRNIQDTRYQRDFTEQTAQQNRPLSTLSGIAGIMPQYQAGSSQITGSYGLPVDPLAAGMQGAMSVYGGLYKNAYPGSNA